MEDLREKSLSEQAIFDSQDLVYDAWDAETSSESVGLAKKALKLSPLCADALIILATKQRKPLKNRIAQLEKAVIAGQKALGESFNSLKGCWGHMEARPHMRACHELAEHLWLDECETKAIQHLQYLIKLNPNDNQGIRFLLINWLIITEDYKSASKLITQFDDNFSAAWLYPKLLLELASGNMLAAEKNYRKAHKKNPHVIDFILRKKPIPDLLPHSYGLGGEDEAICYAVDALKAWDKIPKAISWLNKKMS